MDDNDFDIRAEVEEWKSLLQRLEEVVEKDDRSVPGLCEQLTVQRQLAYKAQTTMPYIIEFLDKILREEDG